MANLWIRQFNKYFKKNNEKLVISLEHFLKSFRKKLYT